MEIYNGQHSGQYVVFLIGEQYCALAITEVVEIIRVQPIADVPGGRKYISGMINLRGNIIPVLQLRQRYGRQTIPFEKKTRIIIVHDNEEDIGLIVDEVMMVTHVEEDCLEPPLDMFNTHNRDWFRGFAKVNEKLIGILNLEKALYPDEEEG